MKNRHFSKTIVPILILSLFFCIMIPVHAEETVVLLEHFTEESRPDWTGTHLKFTGEGFETGVHDEVKTYTVYSKNQYDLGNDFAVSIADTIGFNTTGDDMGGWVAFTYGGFNVRIGDCGSRITLKKGETELGDWTGDRQKEWDKAVYSLRYKNGAVSVLSGYDTVIEAKAERDTSEQQITVTNAEHYRLSRIVTLRAVTLSNGTEYVPAGVPSVVPSEPSSNIVWNYKDEKKAASVKADAEKETKPADKEASDDTPDNTAAVIIASVSAAVVAAGVIILLIVVIKHRKNDHANI